MTYKHNNQVGGTHYDQGDLPQHWDLAIMYQWDAFQYQITKYVMRWKTKGATKEKRLEDLKKARSFLDKYIENFDKYDTEVTRPVGPVVTKYESDVIPPETVPFDKNIKFAERHENVDWQCEGYYGDGSQLYRHRVSRALYRAKTLQDASDVHNGVGAGPGYVSQG